VLQRSIFDEDTLMLQTGEITATSKEGNLQISRRPVVANDRMSMIMNFWLMSTGAVIPTSSTEGMLSSFQSRRVLSSLSRSQYSNGSTNPRPLEDSSIRRRLDRERLVQSRSKSLCNPATLRPIDCIILVIITTDRSISLTRRRLSLVLLVMRKLGVIMPGQTDQEYWSKLIRQPTQG
jgi:hypothetical protein